MRHDTDDHRSGRLITPYALLGGVAAAVLLILGALVDAQVVTAAFVLVGLVLAWGWPTLLGLPHPRGTSLMLVASVVAFTAAGYGPEGGMRWLAAAFAACLVLAFLHQLVRTDGRNALVVSLAGSALGIAVLASGAFFRATMTHQVGYFAVITAAGAAALALAVDYLWHSRHPLDEWVLPAGLLLGAALGVALGPVAGGAWNVLLVTGLVGAGLSHALRRMLAAGPDAGGQVAALALGAAAILVAGLIPYAAIWALNR